MKRFVFALMTALVASSPLTERANKKEVNAIKTAVYDWQADTGTVSAFLNDATSFTSQRAYHSAAVGAYKAELDELTHKAVLDQDLPHTQQLEQANTTLVTDGTFQSVVTLLDDLTQVKYTQIAQIQQYVNEINFGHDGIAGRCAAVLPAIDTYFEQAAEEVQALDGDTSLSGVKAIRPSACGQSD